MTHTTTTSEHFAFLGGIGRVLGRSKSETLFLGTVDLTQTTPMGTSQKDSKLDFGLRILNLCVTHHHIPSTQNNRNIRFVLLLPYNQSSAYNTVTLTSSKPNRVEWTNGWLGRWFDLDMFVVFLHTQRTHKMPTSSFLRGGNHNHTVMDKIVTNFTVLWTK